MEVSTNKPFKIVYALYEHQYLGYLFESFAVQLDQQNKLTYQHQNISSLNAKEFDSKLDETDYELIRLMDEIQQDAIMRRFAPKNKKNKKIEDFFLNTYHPEKGDKTLKELIQNFLEKKRSQILEKLQMNKLVFEMGNDGEPTARTIKVHQDKATVLFHFRKNDDNTHYFPTIKFKGEKLDFNYQGAVILCNSPAWMLINGQLISFEGNLDGNKLKPFLRKKFIAIPKKIEEDYYNKFVKNLIEDFDVYAKGFYIKKQVHEPKAKLQLTEIIEQHSTQLFGQKSDPQDGEHKMCFSVAFSYNGATVEASSIGKKNYVELEKIGDLYTFNKISRDTRFEKNTLEYIKQLGLDISSNRTIMSKEAAFEWLSDNVNKLQNNGIAVEQKNQSQKVYFVGQSSLSIEVTENRDWFDINAKVKFGDFEIPFLELRKWMVKGQKEFTLPNGQIAVIPESWFSKYHELFHFMDDNEPMLKKHHISLVQELQEGDLAKVALDRKLEKLRDFDKIDDYPMPKGFTGKLRPYQKAGFNWMRFLSEYNFGGCLADDMGLGKTVQTLALLQHQKEEKQGTTLLIMPTSLLYNWEMEAKKFTPKMKVLKYAGSNRNKNPEIFGWYDLVITSYGISRIDADILSEFYFDYIILDESQTIKNPQSGIAKAVKQLKSRRKLILTGTPIENTTMDLWSQMSFANEGLLGGQTFFKKEFLLPIEKKNDEDKYKKLHSIIKPFIMRRIKSQVATELPDKVEKIMYTEMTEEQQKKYDEVKSSYRNEILEQIEKDGINNSQFMLLKGLTELRQIANHPKMIDPSYEGESGKMAEVVRTLESSIANNHKTLIFSQFVKHLHIIKEYLDQNNIRYSYLDGTTKNRKEQVDKFQKDKKQQVFLISLKAGGLGLNLTAADYVFILDPWWNPAIEAQAVDRAHRIGQENKVFVYKFITQDSVEEKILALQQNKLELAQNLISTEESFMKKLTKDDIEALLT